MSETVARGAEQAPEPQIRGDGSAGDFESLLSRYGDDLDQFDEGDERAPQPAAESPTDPDEGEEGDSADDGEPEAEVDADADGADADDDSGQDAGADGLEVAEVAQALGLDEDQLDVNDDGELLVKYKVGDEQGFVTLAELRKGYQLEKYVTQKSEQTAERARTLEAEHAYRMQALESQFQQSEAMLEALRGRVLTKYEQVDWNALQQQDPGRYAALQVQMQNEMQGLNAEVGQLMQSRQLMTAQQQEQWQQQQQQWMAEQQRKVFEYLPELRDPKAREPVLNEYHAYLSGYGFSDEEIRTTLDHRILRVINDAVQYQRRAAEDAGKAPKKELARKKVLKSPRIGRRPGAAAAANAPASRAGRKQGAMKRLRSSGSAEDAVAFALESGVVDSLL